MIRVLVSDLGNVLLPLEPDRAYAALAAASDSPDMISERVRLVAMSTGIGRGAATAEQFHQALVAELGLRLSFQQFCRAWSDIFREDAEAVSLVSAAHVSRRYLLSNTDPIHWAFIRQQFASALAPFDRLFASHECGLEKPDPGIFRMVMEASGEPAEAHLFVDDIAEYADAARAVGMDALLYQGAQHLRDALLRRKLL